MANTIKKNGYYIVGASDGADSPEIKELEQKVGGIVREGTPKTIIGVQYLGKDYVRDVAADGEYMNTDMGETVTLVVWKAEDGSAIGTLSADASGEVYEITSLSEKECTSTIDFIDDVFAQRIVGVGDYAMLPTKQNVYDSEEVLIGEYYIWADGVFGYAATTPIVNSETLFLSVELVSGVDNDYWQASSETGHTQKVVEDLIYDTFIEQHSINQLANAFWYGTQAEYDAIAVKNPNVTYCIYEGEA